ncbi:hypothetical protein Bca52824_032552 [Brassica carinata]|uniref:Uncharacterized protein n=1 Tax=Brassica carinata TaxID=52824 RepID=A0A8X7V7N6_BRACI|nr:hypothetical protein Bca52824_032552 [Brassica carinata]
MESTFHKALPWTLPNYPPNKEMDAKYLWRISTKGRVGLKKRNNLVSKNMEKSRKTIKEPKLLNKSPTQQRKRKARKKSFSQCHRRPLSYDSKLGKKTMQLQCLLIIT